MPISGTFSKGSDDNLGPMVVDPYKMCLKPHARVIAPRGVPEGWAQVLTTYHTLGPQT